MQDRFDELAKAVAGGLSRREALRRLGGGLAAVFLSAVGLAPAAAKGGNTCNDYCKSHFAPGPAPVQCQRVCDACGGNTSRLCTGGPTQGVVCCASGQSCCTTALGVPYCANLVTDTRNCGQCGNTCPVQGSCVSGVCVCPAGNTVCTNTCVNLRSNVMHCGACGYACANNQMCCNGVCKNTSSDENNCGACGHQCGFAIDCCQGTCVDLLAGSDPNNCGECGIRCRSGRCLYRFCTCTTNTDCPLGQECVDSGIVAYDFGTYVGKVCI